MTARRSQVAVRLLVALVLGATAVLAAGGLGSRASAADAGAEGEFTALVNDARTAKGLAALASDAELVSVARRWSGRMAADNRVAHNPNLAREVTQNWEKLAENVGSGPTVDEIHEAFMNSSSHRVNILDGSFTHIGVGVATSPDGRLWVTQVFMRLSGGGGGGGGSSEPSAPATTAKPRAPRAPATTNAPAPAPTTPRAPRTRATSPASPTAPAPPVGQPDATAQDSAAGNTPAPPAVPSARLVLVLDTLRALDTGR